MQLTRAEGAKEAEADREPSFEVVDLFDGCFALEKRSATLGGSAPLRVAQACLPLLEGNAIGFQLVLRKELALASRLDGAVRVDGQLVDDLDRRLRGAIPLLRAQSVLDHEELDALGTSVVSVANGLRSRTLTLFTGLLVRPRAGVLVRVSGAGNRRSRDLQVKEAFLAHGRFRPLRLTLTLDKRATRLFGEVASLIALPEECELKESSFDDAHDLVDAHLRFYDANYFETKRAGNTTRKYRSMIAKEPDGVAGAFRGARVLNAGARLVDIVPKTPTEPSRLLVRNAFSFYSRFDGLHLTHRFESADLETFAAGVRTAWSPRFPPDQHPGALLYLTKYFTPHPPGEPHFFVKPPALIGTPAGWSTLLEGYEGSDYDVLRGVVRTDSFHATPAVFHLLTRDEIRIAAGTPLLSLFPFPRELEAAPFRSVAWSERGLS